MRSAATKPLGKTRAEFYASDETLLAILDSAIQGIVMVDSSGSIAMLNNSACEMFGYTKAELLGCNVEQLVPEALRATHLNYRRSYMARPHTRPMGFGPDLAGRRKDGSEFPTEISLSNVKAPGGILAIAFITDISERRRLENELRLSQKMEAIGRLAGGLAHDFNNMLTIIAGYNQMLLDELAEMDNRHGHAEEIQKAVDRATRLSAQLLAFGRQKVLQPRSVNLNDIVMETRKMVGRLIGEDIQVVLDLDPNLGSVVADPMQIEQVLFNLAANARDAMPTGGRLTIETKNIEVDKSCAQAHVGLKPGPWVHFAVSDTGKGMDSQTLQHIFEPFFTTKERGQGMGLGLASVFGSVKQSGGEILVYSEVGTGTTFKMCFPRTASERLQANQEPRPAVSPGTETVLVVEDERAVRRLVTSILEKNGYTVLEARDPLEALTKLHNYSNEVHLLLTDMTMPHMSGARLAALITERRPNIKVVYMSGYTENAVLNNGLLDERVPFLSKPFSQASLLALVRSVIDRESPS